MPDKPKKQYHRGTHMPMRLIIAALCVAVEIALVVFVIYFFAGKTIFVYALLELISILMVIYIISKKSNPSYKIIWVVYILLFPVVGGLVYLMWGGGRVFPHVKRDMRKFSAGSDKFLRQDEKVKSRLLYEDILHSRQASYITRAAGFPVYDKTKCKYLYPGEVAFDVILDELKKAEKFIFLEFFILAEGEMWDEIFKVLKQKRKSGVEVKIIFDDFGSITRQYRGFINRLKAAGFEIQVFNRIHPSVNIFMNNRNHRKIIVIDGKVAFTGGINIGDEYINRFKRFGYWMDSAIMLEGRAVNSFVVMFLSMWGFCEKKIQNYKKYCADFETDSDGFVQPYCDGPTNDKNPAEGIYMQLLNTAQRYVYIATPYLIVDSTMLKELTLAASSGIDVRIITPKIPDKKYVHPVTRYSYDELLSAGVRIFEFTPGFVHSKIFVSDDSVATVGTVNMDYRSFYFHFECGVWMCGNKTVNDVKTDFLEMQAKSEEIEINKWRSRPWYVKLIQTLLHLLAPFM